MKNWKLVGIGALLIAECAASFVAGAVSYGMVQECKAREMAAEAAPYVEDIGIQGAWFKFTAGSTVLQSEVENSMAAEMLAKALPMKFTFQRTNGLLVARPPIALPAAVENGAPAQAGDLIYMTQEQRLAIVLDPQEAPKDAIVLGHMGKEAAEQLDSGEAWEISLGR